MDVLIGDLNNEGSLPHEVFEPFHKYDEQSVDTSRVIIASDDLELFCRECLYSCHMFHSALDDDDYFGRAFVLIDVLDHDRIGVDQERNCFTGKTGRAKRLLHPFRKLHGIGTVYIIGHVEESYSRDMAREISKPAPNAEKVLASVSADRSEGDQHFDNDDPELALAKYQAIIDDIDTGYEWPFGSGQVSECPWGQQFLPEKRNLAISLLEIDNQIHLADTCIALKKPHELRKWAWLADYQLHHLNDYLDRADYEMKLGKVWCQLAWASKAMDKTDQAMEETDRASYYDVNNTRYQAERDIILELM